MQAWTNGADAARRRDLSANHRQRLDDIRCAGVDVQVAPRRALRPIRETGSDSCRRRLLAEPCQDQARPTNSFPQRSWGESWRAAEAAAERLVRSREDVRAAVARATAIADRDSATRLSQLRLRAMRTTGSELVRLEEELHREEVIARAMSAAMAAPSLRLDSTGIVILSGRP